ncbi:hypothetical protein Acr_00g0075330 [Actinidia rufa]|uniref:Uncharacterized protein n=1 Tax=Actinidia rufa TaxID=165716 RepID=A0A7J0DV25_9ERIC|nr:hypothetical protein Acr_00g0075330 [Actinidia rufa]
MVVKGRDGRGGTEDGGEGQERCLAIVVVTSDSWRWDLELGFGGFYNGRGGVEDGGEGQRKVVVAIVVVGDYWRWDLELGFGGRRWLGCLKNCKYH